MKIIIEVGPNVATRKLAAGRLKIKEIFVRIGNSFSGARKSFSAPWKKGVNSLDTKTT